MLCAVAPISRSRCAAFLIVWAVLLAFAMYALERYRMTPAAVAAAATDRAAPATRPAQLPHHPGRLMLVMCLHPRCPCSRASLDELEVLLTCAGPDRIDANVIIVEPDDAPAGWSRGELWDHASRIPGVTVRADPAARDAIALGASISGDVRLFAADGRLLFAGGITDGRGHDGDNAGVDAIVQLARGQAVAAAVDHTPVYGCRLTHGAPPARKL